MELKAARQKYRTQKKNAAVRGIAWRLTFQQWLDWWGGDLDRRGRGLDQLQMQRFGDVGGYELGNIRKGVPKQNGRTYSQAVRNRNAVAAKAAHEAALDAAEVASDGEDEREESISEYMSRDRDDFGSFGCKWDRLHR